jgi:Domain of unknown function (DUF4157)
MQMETPSLQTKQNNNSFFTPSPISITPVQRKCAHCNEEEKQMQRKQIDGEETTADNNVENYVGGLSSGGQALPNEVRNFYEPRFGYDFGNVKIHTDTVAAKSAQSINALAYTSGSNIVFNNGQYSPNTDSGKRLLGHELTHVVQQNAFSLQTKIQKQHRESHEVEMGTDFPLGIEIPFNRMELDDKLAIELTAAMEPFVDELFWIFFFLVLLITAGMVAAAYLEPVMIFIGMYFPAIYAWLMANMATIIGLAQAAGLTLALSGLMNGMDEISEGLLVLDSGITNATSMGGLRNHGRRAGRLFASGMANVVLSTIVLSEWLQIRGLIVPVSSSTSATTSSRSAATTEAETAAEIESANPTLAASPPSSIPAAVTEPAIMGESTAATVGTVLPEVEILSAAPAESTTILTESLLEEPLTPNEMYRTLISETAFRGRVAVGRIIHHGSDTRVIIQITNSGGRRVLIAIGRNSSPVHAEDATIRSILQVIERYSSQLPGGEIELVVNQVVCPDCISLLRSFAEQYQIRRVISYIFRRSSLRGSGVAGPRTTFSSVATPAVEGSTVEMTETVIHEAN